MHVLRERESVRFEEGDAFDRQLVYEAEHAFERVLHAEHVGGPWVGVGVLAVCVPAMVVPAVVMIVVGVRFVVVPVRLGRVGLLRPVSAGVFVLLSVMVAVLCHSVTS
ncbi:MAG: hypothetical protein OXE50_10320 [Chloroflexi bacterium]|nr:hypothetical protein [Chloroflexota bacterium]